MTVLPVNATRATVFAAALTVGCGEFERAPGPDDEPSEDGRDPESRRARDQAPPREEDGADAKTIEAQSPKDSRAEPSPSRSVDDEDDRSPIELSDVAVTKKGGLFGGGSLEVATTGRLRNKIDSATYVQAKAVCRDQNRFLTDVAFVNADYRKPLADHEVGETVELTGRFFIQGDQEVTAPCQLEFRLAGAGGGVSIPLHEACFAGEDTQPGPCSPPIVAPAPSSSGGKPMRVSSLQLEPPALGGKGGLEARYVLEIREPQDNGTKVTLKAACEVDGVKLVDVGVANLMAGPFRFEAGESVARSAALFFKPAFGFSIPPKRCDLQVATWQPTRGSFGSAQRVELHRACYRDDRIVDRACEESNGTRSPRSVTSNLLEVGRVEMEVVEPYGSEDDRFQLKLQADTLVKDPVDQFASVSATVTCKVGKSVRVERTYLYGVELHYLESGETTRTSGTAFTSAPMDKRPRSCEADFMAGRRFSASGDGTVGLGKWCLRNGITKKGKC